MIPQSRLATSTTQIRHLYVQVTDPASLCKMESDPKMYAILCSPYFFRGFLGSPSIHHPSVSVSQVSRLQALPQYLIEGAL